MERSDSSLPALAPPSGEDAPGVTVAIVAATRAAAEIDRLAGGPRERARATAQHVNSVGIEELARSTSMEDRSRLAINVAS
jgi:hypothetical protein